jgi:hypothetical protein
MRCPDFGTWRARLDGAADGSADLDSHVATCERCRALVEELRADAARAAALIGALAPASLPAPSQLELARERLGAALRSPLRSPLPLGEGQGVGHLAPAGRNAVAEQCADTSWLEPIGQAPGGAPHPNPLPGGEGVGLHPATRFAGTRLPGGEGVAGNGDPAGTRLPGGEEAALDAEPDPVLGGEGAALRSATRDGDARLPEGEGVATTTRHGGIVMFFRRNRWRVAAAGIAAGLALTFLAGTPEGRTAAAQFLAQFRSQRFAVVTFDSVQTGQPLRELEHLGTVQGSMPLNLGQAQTVPTIAEASRRVGFAVKRLDPAALPTGLKAEPTIMVTPASVYRFTFDRAQARAYFDSIGRSDVAVPQKFDGASLVVSTPPAAILRYAAVDNNVGLIVAQSPEVTVGVEGGVTLDELREYLLGLPGLPPETAQQLRAIQDWRNTVPVPVAVDKMQWQETTIAGAPGLLLADNMGVAGAAMWQRDGKVYVVAGAATTRSIQRAAESLR